MKKLAINLSLTIVSVIFVLAIVSVVLRYTHLFGARIAFSMPDEEVGFRFVPNKRYWSFKENDHPISGRFNRFGWRDVNWPVAKPAGEYRIAVLGDSFVESFQVEERHSFLNIAEKKLSCRFSKKFELMNFGRASYTQTEELIVLKKEVLKFEPDMVMLFFLPGNDIADVSRETAPNKARPFFVAAPDGQLQFDDRFKNSPKFKIRKKLNFIKQHSILFSFVAERYNAFMGRRAIKLAEDDIRKVSEGYLSLCTSTPGAAFARSYELNKRLIKEMASVCQKNGIQMVLVVTDTDAYQPLVGKKYKDIDPSFDPNFFEDNLKSLAKKLGIGFLGLQRIFHADYQKNGKKLHWGHWNYDGHKTVADAIVKLLEKNHWTI